MAASTKKGPGASKPAVDMKLLSKEAKEALRKEAERTVLEEMTQEARDAYFAKQLADIRRSHVPAKQFIHVVMELAPYMPYVMIDGVQYFHGYPYDVERQQAIVLYEQMQRSWAHQDEIDGRSRHSAYRRPQNVVLGPRHQNTVTLGSNGVVDLPEDMEV